MSDTKDTNPITSTITSVKGFVKNSRHLVNRCSKPDKKEYTRVVYACAIGFAIMGMIGFFVKLVFIPVNNILLTPPS